MRERGGGTVALIMVVVAVTSTILLEFMFYNPDIDWQSEMVLYKHNYREPLFLSQDEKRTLIRNLNYLIEVPVNTRPFYPEYIITGQSQQGETRRIYIFRTARLGWDEKGRAFTLNQTLCRLLDNPIINLENCISAKYGELVPWEKAKSIFAMYDVALVTDVDTASSFWVQRRGGNLHADVQPLTARDSGIMKSAFGGKWSWERRAIVVACRGRRLAASMNGMPHGAGAIKDNDFDGHFCIHFYGSKTHGGSRVDERHQQMVLKAAGRTTWEGI